MRRDAARPRRRTLVLIALATLSALVAQRSLAQTTTRPVTVGILSGASLSTTGNVRFRDAFVEALRQRGWEEGKNLIVEARAAEGDSRRFAELAAELLALNVDVAV